MFSIFIRTIRDWKYSIITYALSSAAFLWMYVAIFPSIQAQSASYSAILQSLPQSVLKIFGMDQFGSATLENLLGTKQFSLLWPIVAVIFVVSLAGGFIAAEVEKGTIEYLLALPISRIKLFFSRYSVGIFAIIIFVIFSVLAVIPMAKAYNIPYDGQGYITLSLLSLIFLLAIYGLGMMFSAIFSEKGKVYVAMGSILVLMYVANIVALLKDNLVNLKYFSFFYYYNYSEALTNHHVTRGAWVVFITVAVVSTVIGCIWFKKKDIAV